MRRFLLLIVLFSFGWSSKAYAEPRCGDVEEDFVEDVFHAANRVDSYFDVEDDLEDICKRAEAVRKWERAQPKGSLKKAYKNKRDDILKDIEYDMQGVTSSLTALRGWMNYDAVGTIEKAKRVARIRKAKRDTHYYIKNMRGLVRYLEEPTR